MQEPLWINRPEHEALWLGLTGTVALSPADYKVFLGPELLYSRFSNPRGENRAFNALWIRPEIGGSSNSEADFYGLSAGVMHLVAGVPFTLAARSGSFQGGVDAGFYGTLTLGVVLSSPLFWMQ